MTTLNQEQHHKAENARHWVAASAESQSLSERGSVRPNEAVRPAESQHTGGDPLRVKVIRSWVKRGGPGRQVAVILAALLIGVPVALLIMEPLLSVIVMVVVGIFMVRALAHGNSLATDDKQDDFSYHSAGYYGDGHVYDWKHGIEDD